jgi:hypothetical protein
MPAAQASAATVPPGMLGMNDWTPPSEQTLATVASAGVRRWRAPLFWYLVERERGVRDWSEYDGLVAAASRRGVSLLLVVASCPDWACANLSGPPTGADAVAAQRDFLRAAVLRYGTNGAFWRQHPELPPLPVTDWQVWNEVNSREFWKPAPSAAGYARFLRDDSATIRTADPHATVVLSGLTEYGDVRIADFLRQLYAQPGFASSFDVLALHAYAPDAPAIARLLDRAKRVLDEHGDARRPVWITELGWGTTSARLHTPTTEGEQAKLLRQSYDMLIGCRSRWGLSAVYWFAYRDFDPPPGRPDLPGYHTGLFDTTGRAKPAWTTFQGYREGAALPAGRGGGCGPGAAGERPPQTRIRGRRRFRGTRRARLRLVASERRARFECRLARVGAGRTGRRWRRCNRRYSTPPLRPGRYRLWVRAVDRRGNADRTPARAQLRLGRGRPVTILVRILR